MRTQCERLSDHTSLIDVFVIKLNIYKCIFAELCKQKYQIYIYSDFK